MKTAIIDKGLLRDFRFALRTLAKSPGFSVVGVLMLGLGIGAVTAMFSIVCALVVKPLSSPNADRLVLVWSSEGQTVSTLDYFDIRDQATSFAELGAYMLRRVNLGRDHPEIVHSAFCTPGVLRAFGVAPALGRWLEEADEQPGAAPVAVISYQLWQKSFLGDPGLIGRPIRLNGSNVTVVGIMPRNFEFASPWLLPATCEIWLPLQLQREAIVRDTGWWLVLGCLKEGVPFGAADAEIKAVGARLKTAHPLTNAKKPFLLTSLCYELTRYGRSYAWMAFGAAVLMLVVACANVASMLLARSARKHGELGIRLAMGASRGRILRLSASEGLILSLAGSGVGCAFAAAALQFFKRWEGLTDARRAALAMDGSTLGFAAGMGLLAGLFAGVLPALVALRVSVADLLRSDTRSATGSSARQRLLRGLIVTQVAVAFVLANVAVLFSASYTKLLAANASLATEYVLSAEINLSAPRYERNEDLTRFCEQLSERIKSLPGVTAAGTTSQLPLAGGANRSILVNDEAFDPAADRVVSETSEVTPGYFAAAGIPLLQGRTLQAGEVSSKDVEVVVNRALAEVCWPKQDPLGKIIRPNAAIAWFRVRVVGVVENVHRLAGEAKPPPQMYWTANRAWSKTQFLVIRSAQPAVLLAPGLRQAVAEMDSEVPLSRVRTLNNLVQEATLGVRIITEVMNYGMVLAIALLAIGLYGTLSYHVVQRTREMGVRMALGATESDVLRLVLRQGFGWVLAGILVGAVGALASARTLRAVLYGVEAVNPLSLAAAAGAVALAAAVACWLPARRAAKADPLAALRCE